MTEPKAPRRQLRRPGAPREIVHKVRVNQDQELRLSARAAEQGITISRLLVESALAGGADAAAAKGALAGEMFRMARLLGQVSNNVNQLARVANATGQIPPAVPAALDALTRSLGRLDGFLEDVRR